MYIVLTHGRYDDYGIREIIEVEDDYAADLMNRKAELETQQYALSNMMRDIQRQQTELRRRLDGGMKKHHKIAEANNKLEKLDTELAATREKARANYRTRQQLSQEILKAGTPVAETEVAVFHLD